MRYGNVECLETVILHDKATMAKEVEPINSTLTHNITAIDVAIYYKQTEMINCLLDHGSPYPAPNEWPQHKKIRALLSEAQAADAKKNKKKSK